MRLSWLCFFMDIGQDDGRKHTGTAGQFLQGDGVTVKPDGKDKAEDRFKGNKEGRVGVARILLGYVLRRKSKSRIQEDQIGNAGNGGCVCLSQAGHVQKGQSQQSRQEELKKGDAHDVCVVNEIADVDDLNSKKQGKAEG